jgi:hypothetical protein
LQKNIFSNNEAAEANNKFMKFTQIKVKKDNITFENSTNKSSHEESKSNTNSKITENKNFEIKKKNINIDNSKYKNSVENLRGVELNKTFYYILKNKISSNTKNSDKLYSKNEFCKKYCGEKLFKNLDLNQRFQIKKTGEAIIHNHVCPLFKNKINKIRTNSVPFSYRELRKNSVEKDLTLLDLSLAVNKAKSIVTPRKATKTSSQIKENSCKILNITKNSNNKSVRAENENNDYCNQDFTNFVEYNKIKNRTIVLKLFKIPNILIYNY